MQDEKSQYRQNVGLCILNKEGSIFTGKRIKANNDNEIFLNKHWQMPQGGVDSLEDEKILLIGMYRELKEETGIDENQVEILKKSSKMRYNFPEEIMQRNKLLNKNHFIGQEQIWFLLKFLGNDRDIDINQDAHPEFCEWKWSTKEFIIDNIIEMKKEIYLQVFDEFKL